MSYSGYSTFSRLSFYILAIALLACRGNVVEPIEIAKVETPEVELQSAIVYDALDSLLMGITTFNSDSVLKNASFAYLIYDATSDSIIAERNPDLSLMPASTIKLFTTAAALEKLGPGANFKTRLLYSGKIENRILKGNLIIKGGGNPTFGAGDQTMSKVFSAWGSSIAQLNIDSITGDIIGDARFFSEDFIPHSWSLHEINPIYNAAPSGLSINGITFSSEFDPTQKELIIPQTDELAHKYPNSILDPALLAATLFRKKLIEKGIHVAGKATSSSASDSLVSKENSQVRYQIASVASPSVASLVRTVNINSDNFLAETLLKQMGAKKRGYGSTEAGIDAVYSFIKSKDIDASGFYMFDGSGLSRYNAITVNQLVHLLKHMQYSPDSSRFISSLAIVGQSGTLSKMCLNTEAAGNIQGKSGTITRVKSYAGYAKSRSGHTLIFAIIVNNFNCTSVEMRLKIEELLILMSAL